MNDFILGSARSPQLRQVGNPTDELAIVGALDQRIETCVGHWPPIPSPLHEVPFADLPEKLHNL